MGKGKGKDGDGGGEEETDNIMQVFATKSQHSRDFDIHTLSCAFQSKIFGLRYRNAAVHKSGVGWARCGRANRVGGYFEMLRKLKSCMAIVCARAFLGIFLLYSSYEFEGFADCMYRMIVLSLGGLLYKDVSTLLLLQLLYLVAIRPAFITDMDKEQKPRVALLIHLNFICASKVANFDVSPPSMTLYDKTETVCAQHAAAAAALTYLWINVTTNMNSNLPYHFSMFVHRDATPCMNY